MKTLALGLFAVALGGVTRSVLPTIQLETTFHVSKLETAVHAILEPKKPLPKAVPVVFNPLLDDQGNAIIPSSTEFSIIVPKIGINAAVIADVDPSNYTKELFDGVAHAKTSFFPNESGAVYLFSHSTNYEWFVKDLNAVFYLMKNLEAGDLVVLVYKGVRYTYTITEKRVVPATDVSYLAPIGGKQMLILQTCWPPGSTFERLLILADLMNTEVL